MSYDFVVVGAGMFGAAFARTATDRGRKVLVLEKRGHLGGMCHTQVREGIVFHSYGPHVFHTNDPDIWGFIRRFASFEPFVVRTKAMAKGKLWSFPVNLMTFYQLWGVATPEEARRRLEKARMRTSACDNLEDWVLATYGREIYETFFEGYTWKQWGRDPKSLPPSIAQRLPLRLTFDDNYFTDRFQGIPMGGYAPLFERMLEGIEVRTRCDFFSDRRAFESMGRIVYSGRVDEFFDWRFGPLAFRTCRFETELMEGDFQGNPVINYCDRAVPFTRIVEHKHFSNPKSASTLITREYPEECEREGTPLYPVHDRENAGLHCRYAKLSTSAVIAGRLGSYRYFDMGEVIAQAWKLVRDLC
jgi:UDP-galactopyranose mutase